jgi:signal transduction histidine kinase
MRKLRASTRQIASGDFSTRCSLKGDREFVELGEDFNRMADELAAFYERLERMVYDKSRELVRAERLASVGYLAAGVAHEINNPLNIMSGHAELSAKQLRRSPDEQNVAAAVQALTIIREEAFRCKEITGKLLSLVKGGTSHRETVSLSHCASDVALMLRGLKNCQGRRIEVAIDPTEKLEITANATEMKQVILNLCVNALEAVRPGTGVRAVLHRKARRWRAGHWPGAFYHVCDRDGSRRGHSREQQGYRPWQRIRRPPADGGRSERRKQFTRNGTCDEFVRTFV